MYGADSSDSELLAALPRVFEGVAACWFRTEKNRVRTWGSFVKAFRSRFIGEYDEEDIMEDLRKQRAKASRAFYRVTGT